MLIIDRFEGSFAVCEQEDNRFQTIPRFLFPSDCKEGDCFEEKEGTYVFLKAETKLRKEAIERQMKELFED